MIYIAKYIHTWYILVNISIHDIYLTSRIIQIIYFNETTIKNPNNILVFQTSFYILHCDAKDPELKYLGLRIRQNLRIQWAENTQNF